MFYKAYIPDGIRNGKKREPGKEAKNDFTSVQPGLRKSPVGAEWGGRKRLVKWASVPTSLCQRMEPAFVMSEWDRSMFCYNNTCSALIPTYNDSRLQSYEQIAIPCFAGDDGF